jgi:hypothetical protein
MTIKRIPYHGWPEALLLSNGAVEAIVVPEIGRVMQFRFAGEGTGAFWENRELDGQSPSADADTDEWLNLGGDKTWPAPQSEWERHTGRGWPPPVAFDSGPFSATVTNEEVVLASEVDPGYGIRAVRYIRLVGQCPQLRITTEFQKEKGTSVDVSVWVITQLPEPERVFALLPEHSEFPCGFQRQRGPLPKDLRRDGRFLSLKRDPREYIKIGTDATCILWMDQRRALLIRAEDTCGAYPDGGCRTEIYTNPDPLHYVELETLGPLSTLEVGARIAAHNLYTLLRRTTPDCMLEAQRAFELVGALAGSSERTTSPG